MWAPAFFRRLVRKPVSSRVDRQTPKTVEHIPRCPDTRHSLDDTQSRRRSTTPSRHRSAAVLGRSNGRWAGAGPFRSVRPDQILELPALPPGLCNARLSRTKRHRAQIARPTAGRTAQRRWHLLAWNDGVFSTFPTAARCPQASSGGSSRFT